MKQFKVLGSGCAKCTKTAELIERLAQENDVAIELEKVTDPEVIMAYGVMSTPAVVLDEHIVHTGSIPLSNQVKSWLQS